MWSPFGQFYGRPSLPEEETGNWVLEIYLDGDLLPHGRFRYKSEEDCKYVCRAVQTGRLFLTANDYTFPLHRLGKARILKEEDGVGS